MSICTARNDWNWKWNIVKFKLKDCIIWRNSVCFPDNQASLLYFSSFFFFYFLHKCDGLMCKSVVECMSNRLKNHNIYGHCLWCAHSMCMWHWHFLHDNVCVCKCEQVYCRLVAVSIYLFSRGLKVIRKRKCKDVNGGVSVCKVKPH